MKKLVTFLASIALLCSCEKFEENYTYEDTVPNTIIKEAQLGQAISHEAFLEITDGIRYEHVRSYSCRKSDGKVYYSYDIEPVFGGIYDIQYQFYQDSYEQYIATDALTTEVVLRNYTYDDESTTLTDMYHRDIQENIENKLLYADKEYLIFETKGLVDDDRYYTKGADCSRIVYRSVEDNEWIIPTDIK